MHLPIAASPILGDIFWIVGAEELDSVMAEDPSSTRDDADIEEVRETRV